MTTPTKPSLSCPLLLTHITTATVLLKLNNTTTFLTDPVFSPAGTEYDYGSVNLKVLSSPALSLSDLPPIDCILLSHEDHPDNLDSPGRTLLNGRRVLTTPAGRKALAPRPGVVALKPWETVSLDLGGGKKFDITGTPARHLPGGEVVGFLISSEEVMGTTDGKPNAVWFSGDTVYMPELLEMKEKFHVSVALVNLADVHVPAQVGEKAVKITMVGTDAVKLMKGIGADVLVPIHYEGWSHFRQGREELEKVFREEGVEDRVRWCEMGVATKLA
ncbi:beta-lactamase superfamily domain-containing protein [Coniochaeta sp. 2T2.1]|nr:beta-lactamase superfamily domain-containing protein [Coniochaeta sp. 2T2.1]